MLTLLVLLPGCEACSSECSRARGELLDGLERIEKRVEAEEAAKIGTIAAERAAVLRRTAALYKQLTHVLRDNTRLLVSTRGTSPLVWVAQGFETDAPDLLPLFESIAAQKDRDPAIGSGVIGDEGEGLQKLIDACHDARTLAERIQEREPKADRHTHGASEWCVDKYPWLAMWKVTSEECAVMQACGEKVEPALVQWEKATRDRTKLDPEWKKFLQFAARAKELDAQRGYGYADVEALAASLPSGDARDVDWYGWSKRLDSQPEPLRAKVKPLVDSLLRSCSADSPPQEPLELPRQFEDGPVERLLTGIQPLRELPAKKLVEPATYCAEPVVTEETYRAVLRGDPTSCDLLEPVFCYSDTGRTEIQTPRVAADCRLFLARITGHPRACAETISGHKAELCLLQLMVHHERFSEPACASLSGFMAYSCRVAAGRKEEPFCGGRWGVCRTTTPGYVRSQYTLERLEGLLGLRRR